MAGHPLFVFSRTDQVDPLRIFQIPLDGLANPAGKSFLRLPADLATNLPRVDGVATIVSWTIFYIRDQRCVLASITHRSQFIEQCAYGVHHVDVAHLTVSADVVSLAWNAFHQHCTDG